MRLENYGFARFDAEPGIDEAFLGDTESPASDLADSAAPGRLLTEMAQQPRRFIPSPPPAPARDERDGGLTSRGDGQPADQQQGGLIAAPEPPTVPSPSTPPISKAASIRAAPTWQGMSLPSAATSPLPRIGAEDYARMEAASGQNLGSSSGGGSSFSGFSFGGGNFGGGGDVESWDYSFEGIDGAPGVNISVTYQGDTPISSQTTTTLPAGGTGVGSLAQEIITLPPAVDTSGISSELPSLPDSTPTATASPITAPAPAATPAGPSWRTESRNADGSTLTNPGGLSGDTDGSATGLKTQGGAASAPAAGNASSSNAAPANDSQPDSAVVGQNSSGQDIRAVGSYKPQGTLRLVNDAPALQAGDPNIVADASGAMPMRDDAGTLLYRIDGGKDDGVIRQLVPAGASEATQMEHLDTVVVTGRRDPNAGAGHTPDDDVPTQAMSGTVMLGSMGMAANATRSSSSLTSAMARLAPAARAALLAEMEFGPPQLKGLALGSFAAGAALAAWQARNGGMQRDMLTPEEQRDAGTPLINVPPPALPPLPGFTPEPRDPSDNVLTNPVPATQPPEVETFPIHEQDPEANILTKDGNADNNRDRARASHGRNPGLADPSYLEGQSAVPGLPPEQVGQWAYPTEPRGPKDPKVPAMGQEFQEAGTGIPGGLEINLGGTPRTTPNGSPTADGGAWLDGVRVEGDGQLIYIDRKEWNGWPPDSRPDLAAKGIRSEANRQLAYLPDGAKLEGQFSSASKAELVVDMLTNEQRQRIIVKVVGP